MLKMAVLLSGSGRTLDNFHERIANKTLAAEIQVVDFEFSPQSAANTEITHRITIQGGDHPGLVARLTEVFMEFDANIVRLNAEPISNDGEKQYLIRIAVWMPANREHACLASISNTASSLQMQCSYTRLPGDLG